MQGHALPCLVLAGPGPWQHYKVPLLPRAPRGYDTCLEQEEAGKMLAPVPSSSLREAVPPSSVSGLCTARTDAAGGLGQQIMSLVHSFGSVVSNL